MEQTQLVALAQGLAEPLRQEQQRTKEAEQRAKEAELRASAAKRAEVKAKSELGKQRAGWKQRKKKWLAYKVKHEALKVKYSRMQSIVHKELKARAKGPVSSPPVAAADGPPLPRDKNGGSTPPSLSSTITKTSTTDLGYFSSLTLASSARWICCEGSFSSVVRAWRSGSGLVALM